MVQQWRQGPVPDAGEGDVDQPEPTDRERTAQLSGLEAPVEIAELGFKALLEAAPEAIIIVDADGRIVLVNHQTEAIFGYSADELVGQPLEILLPERFHEVHVAHRSGYVAAPRTRPMGTGLELYGRRHDGSEFPAEVSLSPTQTEAGIFVTSIVRDITERRQADAERARLLAQEQAARAEAERAAELVRRLQIVSDAALAHLTSVDDLLQELIGRIREVLTVDTVSILLLDPESETLVPRASKGVEAEIDTVHVPIGRGFAGRVAAERRPIVIDDIEQAEILNPLLHQQGIRSVLGAPLLVSGRVIGVVHVGSMRQRHFSGDDVQLVQLVADRIAQAIENARLYHTMQQAEETIQRQAARASALAEASRAFAEASLDYQAVLETVSRTVAEVLEGGCITRLLDEDNQRLDAVAVYHRDPAALDALQELRRLHFDPREGLSGQVLATGEALSMPVVDQDHLLRVGAAGFRDFITRFPMHSLLIVPLRVRGRAIGTLTVWRDEPGRPYTDADQTFLQNLADRAALNVDNAQLYREAQAAVLAREEFLSIASHELKTPLTTVKGWVHLLIDALNQPEPDREAILEFADELRSQIDRFEALIGDLLDASRIQQGRLDLQPEPVNLVAMVKRALVRFEHAPERTPRHRLVLDAPEPVIGIWDPDRLDQVLTNLISNALKYSPEGGEVRVTLRRDGERVTITVSDQGIGISAQDQARLFQPFTRSEAARRSASGTGLGLYITRRIVTRHGGDITLQSEPGVGTTVQVTLPRHVTIEGEDAEA